MYELFKAPSTCAWLHITSSDKSPKLFSTISHLEGESCSTNGPQWWSFTFTKSCEISLAQIHSDTGCWMKIVPLFEVTLLVHMVPAATHANGDLCFVTQFQAVGVNECLIKQNNGHWDQGGHNGHGLYILWEWRQEPSWKDLQNTVMPHKGTFQKPEEFGFWTYQCKF